jgi:hypothetical protein
MPARDFQALAPGGRTGETLYITDVNGGPELEARVIELTPSSLVVFAHRPTLQDAIDRAAARMPPGLPSARTAVGTTLLQGGQHRSWIRRHPALFGALVGGAAGAASSAGRWTELYCASGGDEDCLFHGGAGVMFGAGVGAGIGALVGGLIGR